MTKVPVVEDFCYSRLQLELISTSDVTTHVEGLDFIPIVDLRGVTTYHPLAIMAYVEAGIFCYFKNRVGLR